MKQHAGKRVYSVGAVGPRQMHQPRHCTYQCQPEHFRWRKSSLLWRKSSLLSLAG